MNEEEKKAIYKIQRLVEYFEDWNMKYTVVPEDKKYFDSLLNLIDKQQKEIEELKDRDYISDLENQIELASDELKKKDKIIGAMAKDIIEYEKESKYEYPYESKEQVIANYTNLVEKESK